MGQPPMPSLQMPLLHSIQQQQQQQQQGYGNSNHMLAAHYIANNAPALSEGSQYDPTHWDAEQTLFENINKHEDYLALLADYDVFTKMNLMDDSSLDDLYMVKGALTDPIKAFNIISNLYAEKYEELYSKRPSVANYVSLLVLMLLTRDENFLRIITSNVIIPTISKCSSRLFGKIRQKRNAINAASNDHDLKIKLAKLDSPCPTHPMRKEQTYKIRPILFNIGQCARYCKPSDFALLGSTMNMCLIKKYTSVNVGENFMGLKIELDKPILVACQMQVNKNKVGKDFFGIENISCLESFIGKIANKPFTKNPFTMGRASSLATTNVVHGNIGDMQNNSPELANGSSVAVVQNFGVFLLKNGSLSGRTFSNNILFVDNRNIMSEQDLEMVLTIEEANYRERDDVLNGHKKDVDEYNERFAHLVATTIQNSATPPPSPPRAQEANATITPTPTPETETSSE